MANNKTKLIAFGPQANCNLDLCPLEYSIFRYRPSIPANGTFIGLFALLLAAHAFQGVKYRTWGYMACMVAGSVLEIVGYAGRILLHANPFAFNAFLMQIVCITVAPVFFCAAIYVLLNQVVVRLDRSISRFDPRFFYWFFIPADIVSLILQATGGALSAIASTISAVNVGVNISKAGLIFQVAVLTFFLALFGDYLVAYRRKHPEGLSKRMVIFLSFTFVGVVFILGRCVYRIVELKDGYFGPLFREEVEFMVFEAGAVFIALLCLNIGHPGRALPQEKQIPEHSIPLE